MPYTDIDLINQGLGKFSSSKINQINPPKTSLERHCTGYQQWKESELARRRWVFATDLEYDLPYLGLTTDRRIPLHKYELPNIVLRPIREAGAEWKQQGRTILSQYADLTLPVVLNIAEGEFDPLFNEVLIARIYQETVNFVTQADTGRDRADGVYDEAVKIAGRHNAFTIGPERIDTDDGSYPFLEGRSGLS